MLLSKKTPKFYTRHFVKMELEFIFLILGWIAIGVVAYTVYVNTILTLEVPPSTGSASGTEETSKTTPRFIFFSSTHCPWSKKARPQWDAFVEDLKTHPTTYGGKKVSLEEYDGDNHADLLKKHNVTGYPTFKLIVDGKETEMSAIPSQDKFREFLVKSLGPEEHP